MPPAWCGLGSGELGQNASVDQPTAAAALARLQPLVGRWSLTATPPGGEPWPGEAWATFDWHESGTFLVERSAADLPQAPSVLSVIGCDAANGTYHKLYSDDRGVCRVYEMSIDGGEWRLWRDGRPFSQRFVGRFEDGGDTIVGRWEKAEDGADYVTDFDLVYRRAGGDAPPRRRP